MKHLKRKLLIIWYLLVISFATNRIAQTKMQLKKQNKPNEVEKEKPIFELLNMNQPVPRKSDGGTRWGNNPFFQQQPEIKNKEAVKKEPEPQTLTLYEYKVSAIWKINNEYKALLSGHIVKSGDQLNEIKIKKINKQSITVQRKNKVKTFKIGILFYDFQI